MKLTMLRGLPASGKSTRARAMVKETGNTGRVNRDDLRAMLFDSVWTGKREEVVVDCEKAIAKVLLHHGMNVVVDDTNLTDRHKDMWKEFAAQASAQYVLEELTTSLTECLYRDQRRERPVGLPVIHRMAMLAGKIDWGSRPIVLVDIDGTLADGTHREHYTRGPEKDWDKYFSLLEEDLPVEFVVRWVNQLAASGHTIVLVSGRPDTYWKQTVHWLDHIAGVYYDYLLMRPGSDKRDDTLVKAEMLKVLPKEKIVLVLDDRPKVCRMWRENGLKVIPVRGQCEEF